ncbi:leucine-rich repeat-containing protein 14B-like [Branchiostoma floridae]|uniref:Leucine-rich repeat-containing protein 14 n=1 Tax=Branchiostoma floridae TaxID=7739 RepID=A0A9J7L2B1_BRAFL|nr:leucine-rich repeat-containing protein 14B-like [Branchiostoma floridae]
MWIDCHLKEGGKIVKSLSPQGRGIKLHPCRVVSVFLGSILERLGRRLEPQVLTGLELKSDTLESADTFAALLKDGKFPNLSALSLPNFATRLGHEDFQVLGEVLSHLPALRRLNLNGLRMTGQLRQVLQDMPGHLEHLNVSNCRLSPPDLVFLSNSRHAKSLRELSISGMTDFDAMCLLLRSVALQLEWLDMSSCLRCFSEDYSARMTRLVQQCSFSKLRTLDFRMNFFGGEPAYSVFEVFGACDKIRTLRTLYLDSLYHVYAEWEEEQANEMMCSRDRPMNVQVRLDPDRDEFYFKVCWTDTDT